MTAGFGVVSILLTAMFCHPAAAETQCSAAEQVVFSCATGTKTVSVCAAGDLSGGGGSLSYRFGTVGRPEMTLPSSGPPSGWRDVTRSGMWTFAGGGGAWLAFHNEAYRYIVWSAIGRGWGERAGLAVERNGRLLTHLSCGGKPVSELGPDFFSKAGIPEDASPFEMPLPDRG